MKKYILRRSSLLMLFIWLISLPACQNLQQLSSLKLMKFDLDRVSDVRLAGIDVLNLKSARDLGALDLLRVTQAIARRDVPLSFNLHVAAEAPQNLPVTAKLSTMEWTLFLQNKETVSGLLNQPISLPAGQRVDIPVQIKLNAVDFVEGNAQNLVELVKNLIGSGDNPVNLRLSARPTIQTPLGPFRFPNAIDVVSKTYGSNP
ncbi:MAG: LEA type 2 family protein [Bacteroidetes Order II. Incertae sedis bacterium]|nr:LEA type 2 family protein [Bacteroidetes Order II. bacterium]